MKKMRNYFYILGVGLLLMMHTIGLYGLLYDHTSWNSWTFYRDLTAINLCVTFFAFLLGDLKFEKNYLLVALGLIVTGFLIEVVGIKTGAIFGVYNYTDHLGPRLMKVPLVIGLNWSVLILSCAAIVHRVYSNTLVKAAVGATLMTLIDVMLEPVAYIYHYWQWDTQEVPIQNYIAWWIISFVLLLAVFRFLKNPYNRMGYWVYGVQMVFFCLLNLLH